MFFTYYLVHLSSWTLVVVTGERALTVGFPFAAKIACSRARVITCWATIAIALFFINSHLFFTVSYFEGEVDRAMLGKSPHASEHGNDTRANFLSLHIPSNSTIYRQTCYSKDEYVWFWEDVWYTMDLFILALVPFALILAGNLVITVCVLRAIEFRRRHQMAAHSSPEAHSRHQNEQVLAHSEAYVLHAVVPIASTTSDQNSNPMSAENPVNPGRNISENDIKYLTKRYAPLAITESSSADDLKEASPNRNEKLEEGIGSDLNLNSRQSKENRISRMIEANVQCETSSSIVNSVERHDRLESEGIQQIERIKAVKVEQNLSKKLSCKSRKHSNTATASTPLDCLRFKLKSCYTLRKSKRPHRGNNLNTTSRHHSMLYPTMSEGLVSSTTSTTTTWQGSMTTSRSGGHRRSRPLPSCTTMLLGISGMFLVTTVPSTVYFLNVANWIKSAQFDPHTHAQIRLTFALVSIIYYLNNALNFLLYCLTGSRFRRALVDWVRQRSTRLAEMRNRDGQTTGPVVTRRPTVRSAVNTHNNVRIDEPVRN